MNMVLVFFSFLYVTLRYLHSFPTRRSSDLARSFSLFASQIRLIAPSVATACRFFGASGGKRSEEHTSELQSHSEIVCRLLLEKKNLPILLYLNIKLILSLHLSLLFDDYRSR